MKKILHYYFMLSLLSACLIPASCVEEEGTISAGPVTADFSAESTEAMTGQRVTFSDKSSGDVTHWSWIFPGGTPDKSNVQNPSVVYDKPGKYAVTLVVSNARHTDKLEKEEYISVTEAPQALTADFVANKVSILSGETVTFTSTTKGNPDTWSWEFIPDNGTTLTASEENPAVTFDEPGVYSVKLTVSNSAYTDEELKNAYITVVDAASIAADFSVNKTVVYTGQEVTFTDASVGAVTGWQWNFEGAVQATSADQNPVVTYEHAGRYKVTLEVSNGVSTSVKEREDFITVIPGDGLVTFLPFDGSAEDSGPLALSVTNSGSVTFAGTDRHNQASSTAVFDGAGSLRVVQTADKQLGTSSYTVGVWLKTDVPSRMMIWEEGGGGAGLPQAWFRMNDNASTNIYRLNTNTGGFLNIGVGDGASPLSDGQWHYVLCVRDASSGSSRIYVDGQLIKEITGVEIKSLDNDVGFTIGGQYNGGDDVGNLYTGQLDDLVIYKRVLSDEEIALLSEI